MLRAFLIFGIISLFTVAPAEAQTAAKKLFGAKRDASFHRAESFGSYAKGCVAGAVQLPETGPTWQAMRLSRNRNWGHPDMISFVKRLSRSARDAGWAGLYVGDISQPRGGPMLTGHRSHQMGLDADIWMLPAKNLRLSRSERESISSISVRKRNLTGVNGNWTRAHHEIMRAAARDPAVARIFVAPQVKVQMCNDARGDRRWLRKIRPWWGHHYHFHVRLNCPRGERRCANQQAIPQGTGCKDAKNWVADMVNPPKRNNTPATPRKKRRELTMADLPSQCRQVLNN